jgi:hypothetical protein
MGSEYKIPYITTLPETPQNCTKKASEESEAFRFCDPPGKVLGILGCYHMLLCELISGIYENWSTKEYHIVPQIKFLNRHKIGTDFY